jgi:hypothetical protein
LPSPAWTMIVFYTSCSSLDDRLLPLRLAVGWRGVYRFVAWTGLRLQASWVARIIDMRHHCLAVYSFVWK